MYLMWNENEKKAKLFVYCKSNECNFQVKRATKKTQHGGYEWRVIFTQFYV